MQIVGFYPDVYCSVSRAIAAAENYQRISRVQYGRGLCRAQLDPLLQENLVRTDPVTYWTWAGIITFREIARDKASDHT